MSWDWLVIRTFWCVFDAKKTGPATAWPEGRAFKNGQLDPKGRPGVHRAFFVKCVFFALVRRSELLVNIAEPLWGLSHETNISHRLLHGPGFGPDG
jgi:hypothetical protein